MGAIKQFVPSTVTVTDVTAANATDLATAITLVNEIKADLNLALSALRAHGIIR